MPDQPQLAELKEQIKATIRRNSDHGFVPYSGCNRVCAEMASIMNIAESCRQAMEYREAFDIYLRSLPGCILHDTYDQWLASVEEFEKNLKDSGVLIVRAYIDPPHTFPAWCLAKGMLPDEKARSRFAAEAAQQAYSRSIDYQMEDFKNRR